MRSIGVFRNGEKESAYWLTSTDFQRQRFCLTLNFSERPRQANPSRLSEILETNPSDKYRLSARACQGILNRAERRGKELPKELGIALMNQCGMDGSKAKELTTTPETIPSAYKGMELTVPTPQDATVLDGVGGGCYTLNTIDRPAVYVAGFDGQQGAKAGNIGYESERVALEAGKIKHVLVSG